MERVTAIQVGEDKEVMIEELLMKLALSETVIKSMAEYISVVESNGGTRPECCEPPDSWALSGMMQNLGDVTHALKCAGFGHEAALSY